MRSRDDVSRCVIPLFSSLGAEALRYFVDSSSRVANGRVDSSMPLLDDPGNVLKVEFHLSVPQGKRRVATFSATLLEYVLSAPAHSPFTVNVGGNLADEVNACLFGQFKRRTPVAQTENETT